MLEIRGLTKIEENKRIIGDLTMIVEDGSIYGIAGGQSEALTGLCRILAGLADWDEGKIYVDSQEWDPQKKEKGIVGYVPAVFGSYGDMTVEEYMEYYAGLYNISGEESSTRQRQLLEWSGLSGRQEDPADALKMADKRTLALAACCLTDPGIFVLDDFMTGLQTGNREKLVSLLLKLRDRGKAIIITTRVLGGLRGLNAVIGIIQEGKMLLQGTIEEIIGQISRANPLEVVVEGKSEEAVAVLKDEPSVTSISIEGDRILAGFEGNQEQQVEILQNMVSRGVPVVSFQRRKSDLEAIFWKVTNGKEEVV